MTDIKLLRLKNSNFDFFCNIIKMTSNCPYFNAIMGPHNAL